MTHTADLALITLKLDNFTHVTIGYDSAIAGELFLDDGENLLSVKLVG